ncbi:type IV secretion system protein VirD4 [Nitrosomonas eutropha]|uniref:Type IV secretion system protein VirD4 n=1 Tax=Nitrosomonas eutropha TaxID=916 RepID=A0A1I7FBG7_9PROT|nr:type IV secretory system conjugative DNA transfer family protein [Nitrosomonas eutropha]SFU33465.1 type IV secretion system protein VirD4 [Nitrosomonas eutropha]
MPKTSVFADMTPKKWVGVVIGLLSLGGLVYCAFLVSGMVLYASFHENPLKANIYTIFDATASIETHRQKVKVIGSYFVGFFLCLAIPFGMVMAYRRRDMDVYGKGRFANRKDIDNEGLFADKGILLGRFAQDLMHLPGYEFALLAAPTRTGKGVGFVIPNLLTFRESAVVLDIKEENYNLTSAFRRKHLGNEIFYWSPFSETTHRWNPLSYVSENPLFRVNDLRALAVIIFRTTERGDPFWSDSARNLFVGLALLVLETPRLPHTMGEILRQASGKGKDTALYLREVITARQRTAQPLSRECQDSINRFLNGSDDTLKNILSTFTSALGIFSSPVTDKATSADDFDLRNVRKRKMTIYVHIPAGEVTQAQFIVNLFFSQLINENVKELPEHNPALKYQCLLMLDELTAAGKIEILAKGVGFMAGYNMRLALVIQSNSQLESTYGKEDAHSIMDSMGVKIFYTPSQVKEAEEYSKMIGNITAVAQSTQHANVGALNPGRYSKTETDTLVSRALMLPQELLQLDKEKELVHRAGIPIIMGTKIRYYKDDYFMRRFTAVPMHKVAIGDEVRTVPVPVPVPGKNWRLYNGQVQRSDYYLDDRFSDLESPESISVSMLVDVVNMVEENPNPEDAALQAAACEDLALAKVNEFAALFDSLGTTDMDVRGR